MQLVLHPAQTNLRGDGRGYNPREICATPLPGNRELITGVFRDDGVGATGRPDRPFKIVTPIGFQDWIPLNAEIYDRLRSGTAEVVANY
jgi:hypothetical protein